MTESDAAEPRRVPLYRSRLGRILESASNILVVVTCAAALAFMGSKLFGAQPHTFLSPVGLRLDAVADVRFGEGDRTILVGLSSGCRFCDQSMPAILGLIADARHSSLDVNVVILGSESVVTLREYLARQGVVPDHVVRAQNVLTTRTPTLGVVDRDGRLLGAWVGVIGENRRKEVARLTER